MLQERLTNLALVSIKRDFLLVNVKNEIVQTFSDKSSLGKEKLH